MMHVKLLAAFCLSSVALPVAAQSTANITILGESHLRDACDSQSASIKGTLNSGFCIGYIRAVFDQMYMQADLAHRRDPNGAPDPAHCIPSYVTNQIMLTIVQDKLKANAGNADTFAFYSVKKAINDAFPGCFSAR